MLGMIDAIKFFHEKAIYVQNNIRPEKFRIQDGQVQIIDFGSAYMYLD